MKKLIVGIIIFAIVLFIGITAFNSSKHKPKFKTETISREDIVQSVTASGTVNPEKSISVGTQVSGTVKAIYADFNSPVKKGQLLAEIDPSLFIGQVAQSQANVASARANLQKIESTLANDRKTYARYMTLYAKNYVARSDLDLAQSTYNADLAQVSAARAQIAQAQAALGNNQTNLRYTKIISPVNGIVVSRSVDVGQTVAASFQTPTLFLVANDLTKMQIDTSVAEADIGKVKVGQRVEYTLDGYPDMTFVGKVKQIRIAPTTVNNVVTYDVVISVGNKDMKLKPGMTANVSIITSNKKNIIAVPNASLRFTPHHDEDAPKYQKQGVWILGEKGPRRIEVQTGISDGAYTEILSGKLKEGQKIITESLGKDHSESKRDMPHGGPRMF